ncbi:GNAT family N-acetyltransferase [Streptomyces pathocidini]|uniref:GNAT family N-acetyltransferase n=1 Tax=Streptomyces pathocidini TaxID=1650571 RepID=A0ABW7UVL9_9ACTN|nr:GNAT family N-acetyltransferase [Streptomyces pathocidini]
MNASTGERAAAYEVRVAAGEADLAACFAVRHEVFVGEQGVPADIEYDAYDAGAVHVLAVGADGPLGTGRLLHGAAAVSKNGGDEGVGALGRLAVSRAARGLGVGAALVRAIEAEAARLGLTAIDLHAQVSALGFYERLGYAAYGGEFLDAGIVHRAMRRAL